MWLQDNEHVNVTDHPSPHYYWTSQLRSLLSKDLEQASSSNKFRKWISHSGFALYTFTGRSTFKSYVQCFCCSYHVICGALRDLVRFVQFKKREKHLRGVLLLIKLQALACKFTKSNTPPWVFFTFFKLYKWYQIVKSTTYYVTTNN